ncbi:MAG TPA: diacylglycerol kinase family protein [Pseudomonadota bacterium]|jgi:diacylglycerol kinase family enzyme|nr:diacylglycerol kinase family protein [Pseudomonadota bacterium]HNI58706.1 diacylglycerol kinase family protein [Pseudomonadota bacterium]HNN51302.1 diacylglycerol kinase family protein [Pseudomonadota bacterium]
MANQTRKDVVLLCNPRAGGRWRALAGVLDSPEAKGVRRIVTDHIDDVGAALADVGQRADLVCIYGGDGTIYHVINEMLRIPPNGHPPPRIFLLGGGTMNVTATKLAMSGTPANNFRAVISAYHAGTLRYRQVPLIAVRTGGQVRYGFTFGMGPLVRLLDRYERGGKGKLAALGLGVQAIAAALSPLRTSFAPLLDQQTATIIADGRPLSQISFAALFANTTGAVQRLVEPFPSDCPPEHFHFLAYAVSAREMAALVPLLMSGKVPLDLGLLRSPFAAIKTLAGAVTGRGELPRDPRYVNHPAQKLRIETGEAIFTLDGEVLPTDGQLEVTLGPTLSLALHP